MKQATKIIIRALIAACLAETAMSASANDAKAWMRPENLRWACYQWENKVHFRRMGGPHVPFWCNSTFLDDYFERLYCKETLQKFKDIGVTCIATSFYKGYGLEAEKEEMARQAGVVRMAHEVGLKVLGYINSDACYYEMLFKELPGAKKILQRDFNGNWRRPNVSYYPHKAKLCVGWPGYLEWMKKVITRAFELGYDGIHFDMAQQGTCFCEACTRQFREYLEKNIPDKTRLGFTGFEHVEIPYVLSVSAWDKKLGHVERTVDPMAQEWIKFNAERFHRVRKEMYDFVKCFGEDKCVVINSPCYDVAGGGDPLRYRDAGDCFYIESNFPYAMKDGNIRTSVFNYKNMEAMNVVPIPTQWLMKDGKVALPETPKQITIGVLESAVYGGVPGNTWSCRTISGKNLHLDYAELTDTYAKVISFLDANRRIYAGSKSLPCVTILSTWEDFAYNRDTEIRHQALNTMMYTLQRANIPFRYEYVNDFDPKTTDAKMVILSDCHAISKADAGKIIEFVKGGGCLLATGASGDYNENVLRYAENLFDGLPKDRYSRLAPAPEKTSSAALYPEVWGKHVTNYPKDWKKIVDAVRRFADPFMPYTTESDDGVFIEPRINAEGRLFIHVLNFWDTEKRFRITLKQGMPVKVYDLGDNAVTIDGRTVSGRVKNYLVIDCGSFVSGPSWSGKEMKAWSKCCQCKVEEVTDEGVEVSITGNDSQLYVSCDPFVPKGNHCVYVRAKAAVSGTGQLYWMAEKSPRPTWLRHADFDIVGDGQWHTYRLRPFWTSDGRITGLRLDFPSSAVGTRATVAEVRVAEEGEELAVDASCQTGVMFDIATTNVEYATFMWGGHSVTGFAMYGFATAADGRSHTYWFDLAKVPSHGANRGAREWRGLIDRFYVRQMLKGQDLPVKNLRFISEKPDLPPDPAVTSVRPMEAVPRAGRPLELEVVMRNYGTRPVRGLSFALDGLPPGVAAARPEELKPAGEIGGAPGFDTVCGSVGSPLSSERRFRVTLSDPGVGEFTAGLTVSADGVRPFRTPVHVKVLPSLNLPKADYPPEPKPVDTAPYEVGAFLFPGWTLHKWHTIWSRAPWRKPLLGWYDETNPEVVDWQIKHLVENGISYVSVCWYWKKGVQSLNHWMTTFQKARYRRYLKWSLMWANHIPKDSHSEADQEKVTRFWIENYFCQPEYQRINDMPVVGIWCPGNMDRDLGPGGCRRLLEISRKVAREAGYKGIWFVAVRSPDGITDEDFIGKYKEQGFDMTYCYRFMGSSAPEVPKPICGICNYADIAAASLPHWRALHKTGILPFLPSISTGFDNRPWIGERSVSNGGISAMTNITVDSFARICRDAKRFSDETGVRMLQVGPLDEWGEGSIGYPNSQHGFGMLEAVRDTFGRKPEGGWPVNYAPVDVGLGPYTAPYVVQP